MPIVSLKNVTKSYFSGNATHEVIQDVSLDVYQGEFISIIGPSGSGKSTILKLIGLLDIPSSGVINIDKINCNQISEKNKQS